MVLASSAPYARHWHELAAELAVQTGQFSDCSRAPRGRLACMSVATLRGFEITQLCYITRRRLCGNYVAGSMRLPRHGRRSISRDLLTSVAAVFHEYAGTNPGSQTSFLSRFLLAFTAVKRVSTPPASQTAAGSLQGFHSHLSQRCLFSIPCVLPFDPPFLSSLCVCPFVCSLPRRKGAELRTPR